MVFVLEDIVGSSVGGTGGGVVGTGGGPQLSLRLYRGYWKKPIACGCHNDKGPMCPFFSLACLL